MPYHRLLLRRAGRAVGSAVLKTVGTLQASERVESFALRFCQTLSTMSTQEQSRQFLSEFSQWAASRPDILGVGLVGSYGRDEPTETSDIDLVIIAREPQTYLRDTRWAEQFGTIKREQVENCGKVTSLRVWYSGSLEVEYGFTDETWRRLPMDEGTRRVVSDGLQILSQRQPILSRLKNLNGVTEHSEYPSSGGC
jgi:predicted nucleotidyltransferase